MGGNPLVGPLANKTCPGSPIKPRSTIQRSAACSSNRGKRTMRECRRRVRGLVRPAFETPAEIRASACWSGCGRHVYRTGGDFGACSRVESLRLSCISNKAAESLPTNFPTTTRTGGQDRLAQDESNRAFILKKSRVETCPLPIPFDFPGICLNRKNMSHHELEEGKCSNRFQEAGKSLRLRRGLDSCRRSGLRYGGSSDRWIRERTCSGDRPA